MIRIDRFGDLYRCFSASKVPREASVKTNSLVYSSSASMSVGSPASSGGGGWWARAWCISIVAAVDDFLAF